MRRPRELSAVVLITVLGGAGFTLAINSSLGGSVQQQPGLQKLEEAAHPKRTPVAHESSPKVRKPISLIELTTAASTRKRTKREAAPAQPAQSEAAPDQPVTTPSPAPAPTATSQTSSPAPPQAPRPSSAPSPQRRQAGSGGGGQDFVNSG